MRKSALHVRNVVYKVAIRASLSARSILLRSILRAIGVKLGRGVIFWGKVRIGHAPSHIHIGERCSIGHDVFLAASDTGFIEIGAATSINTGCHIVARDRIVVGSYVGIGEYTTIRDQDHDFRAGLDMRSSAYIVKKVTIEDGVWIGRGSFIGKGVHIGPGAVIGANSVVVRNIDPMTVVAGVPAKRIGVRELKTKAD